MTKTGNAEHSICMQVNFSYAEHRSQDGRPKRKQNIQCEGSNSTFTCVNVTSSHAILVLILNNKRKNCFIK